LIRNESYTVIPDFETLTMPMLNYAADKQEHSYHDTIEFLAHKFNLNDTYWINRAFFRDGIVTAFVVVAVDHQPKSTIQSTSLAHQIYLEIIVFNKIISKSINIKNLDNRGGLLDTGILVMNPHGEENLHQSPSEIYRSTLILGNYSVSPLSNSEGGKLPSSNFVVTPNLYLFSLYTFASGIGLQQSYLSFGADTFENS